MVHNDLIRVVLPVDPIDDYSYTADEIVYPFIPHLRRLLDHPLISTGDKNNLSVNCMCLTLEEIFTCIVTAYADGVRDLSDDSDRMNNMLGEVYDNIYSAIEDTFCECMDEDLLIEVCAAVATEYSSLSECLAVQWYWHYADAMPDGYLGMAVTDVKYLRHTNSLELFCSNTWEGNSGNYDTVVGLKRLRPKFSPRY